MRLMITVLVLVLLVIIDQTQFHGHYTAEAARLLKNVLTRLGL
jgi:hypothetical protein